MHRLLQVGANTKQQIREVKFPMNFLLNGAQQRAQGVIKQ